MPNVITAGNSSNGGTAISTDTSGTLNIVTGSGSGANAITIDASQNVAMTASQTIAGNLTVTGTLTASGGLSGGIRSGTAVASTSGTSIDFTSLPTGIKRITVMFSGVSTNGTSSLLIQIGAGSVTNTGYISTYSLNSSTTLSAASSTAGFIVGTNLAAAIASGVMTIQTLGSNIWVSGHTIKSNTTNTSFGAGDITLGGNLDRVRITTVNGTDTFDAGSINILFE